jgi:hypothetical protein
VRRLAFSMGLLATVVAVTTLLVSSVSALPGGARACRTSDLEIGLIRSFAAMTNAGGYIGFTNVSRRICVLHGWPRVVAVRDSGSWARVSPIQTISGHATTGAVNEERVATIALRPGDRADAVVGGTDDPGYGPTRCDSYVRFFRVAPPGQPKTAT